MNHQSEQKIVIVAVFLVVAIIFILRLFYVQVIDSSYKLFSDENVLRKITEYPARGLVFDRNGDLVVYNEASYDLRVVPGRVELADTVEFCQLLGIDRATFDTQMAKAKSYSSKRSSIFLKQLSGTSYARLQEKLYKYQGFFVQARTSRTYPGKIASHVLGYTGEVSESTIAKNPYYRAGDYIGISGIEQQYEFELRGKRGVRVVMVDVFGREKGVYEGGKYDTLAVPGSNITLTLDAKLQTYGEKLMLDKQGAIVAIDPKTGEVLAMVSAPNYDPNLMVGRNRNKYYSALANDSLKPLFNRATMAAYPPGSTFKPLQALAGLHEGVIGYTSAFGCSGGYSMGKLKVGCHSHQSPLDLKESIQHSCNAYYCQVFRRIIDNYAYNDRAASLLAWGDVIRSFGLGAKTGIDLPSEGGGLVPSPEYYDKYFGKGRWKSSTIISLSIGQGELLTTPLQLANMTAAIANKGYYYKPHLIKKIAGKDPDELPFTEKQYTKVNSEYFEIVKEGMHQVVEAGTARNAKMAEISIGGKTGTAENPHGKDHSLFIAFAPVEDPKIAIAVMVENGGWGTTWASPIASLMIEQYLTGKIERDWLEERALLPINPVKTKSIPKKKLEAVAIE